MYARVTGAVLVWYRGRKRMSQRALAASSGVPQSNISRFESHAVPPNSVVLRKLAQALGTTHPRITSLIELVWLRTQAGVAAARGAETAAWWEGLPISSDFLAGMTELALLDEETF